jgi:hypothetical protein
VNNPDTTPPTVSITSPANGSTVSGTITVQITAVDNVGVASVSFAVDGTTSCTDATSPYSCSWNTATVGNGSHTLTATATDGASNTASTSISVNVNNSDITQPTVSITSPLYSDTVSGTVAVNANASDNLAVASVSFAVDGTTFCTDATAPYSCPWDTGTVANGEHSLSATAKDSSNNTTSTSIWVMVNNVSSDTTPPTVSITSPSNGATVAGTAAVNANASDNVGVNRVEFSVDGVLQSTDTTAPYSYSWDTTTASNAAHTLLARAFDAAGSSSSYSISVTVSNSASLSITSRSTSNITSTGATISWTTNLPSTGTVFYGTSSSSMTLSVSSSALGTSHSVVLTGLKSRTNYYYKIVATDGTTTVTSSTASFRTSNGGGGRKK